MTHQPFPIEDAPVSELSLDVKNYRFPIDQTSERAAMNYLFAAHAVMDVARVILRDGYVDNELPLVIREGCALVILEGNRRLSALRALLDPSLVPSHEAELERLLRRYAIEAQALPQRIRVMVVPSREAAAPVLARLHIGDSKRAWSLDEQAKFVRAQLVGGVTPEMLKELLPAVRDVTRLLRMANVRDMLRGTRFGDKALWAYAVSDQLSMSSFEYAYRNPDIQEIIGIAFSDDGSLTRTPGTSQEVAALERLIRGFMENELNTRRGLKQNTPEYDSLMSDLRRLNPSASVRGSGVPSRDDGLASAPLQGGLLSQEPRIKDGAGRDTPGSYRETTETGSGTSSDARRRGPNNPETRRNLDLTGIDESELSLPLKHRVRELRRIDVVEFPAASAMLLRSVLESAIKEHYGLKKGTEAVGMLSHVMQRVTQDYSGRRELSHAISTVNRTGRGASGIPGSGEWFNMVAHSVNVDANGKGVHEAWRVTFPLVRFLLMQPTNTPSP